jgi:ABC-type sugar transport system ATPase subunit
MATLVLENVNKYFDDLHALKNVSFECQDGEFLVILGPSGAGKTTTLNCIAGIEFPQSGTIYLDDKDITMDAPQERNVAMVFETYALYPQLSVYDNLAFPLRSPRYRQPEDVIEERVHKATKLLGIDMLLHRLPKQLSQGQRQRVSLGRALVREPKVFLFDEPISHLDAKLRNAMRRELKRMRSDLGQTTVYVTHDYLEALSLADRVVVLRNGEVLQFDNVKRVYNRPAAVAVGQLFGDLPMMFFHGSIDSEMNFVVDDDSFSLGTKGTEADLSPSQDVILGLRPTDVKLVAEEDGDIKGEVYSVQKQFGSKLVTIEAHDHMLDVIAPYEIDISEGEKAGISVDRAKCFYFDKETNLAL